MQEGDVLQSRYRLVRLIGAGGMGRVYLADDLRLPGKRWAVKETLPPYGDASGFLQEAELLAKLQHPLLPQIVDYYAPAAGGGYAYVVMELVPGVTLDVALRGLRGRLSEDTIVSIGRQLCEALVYLHGRQPEPIVFRDLKPGNIMVDERGSIKLIDFGIARTFKPQRQADTVALGTFGFAAPEQLRGEQTGPRSDLFSLGAVLYYLLSGGSYAGASPRPLGELCPDINALLLQLVERLLAPLSEDRPERAEEVLTALRRLENKAGSASSHSGDSSGVPASPREKPKLIAVGGLYAGAGATFATFCLSYALRLARLEHAVGEHPAAEPEHYALLDGERRAPHGYRFLSEQVLVGDGGHDPEWIEDGTLFVPSPPHSTGLEGWSSVAAGEWLRRIERPIVIVDISHLWNDPRVQPLLAQADELLVVVDPSPAKLRRPRVHTLLRELAALAQSGSRVTWVANRDMPAKHRGGWLRMLPVRELISLPDFTAARLLDAQWKGSVVPISAAEREQATRAFAPFVASRFGSKSEAVRRKAKA